MSAFLVQLCAPLLLMTGGPDSLSRLVEAYQVLLALPEVSVGDLRRMEESRKFFEMDCAGSSEKVVVRDALGAVGRLAGGHAAEAPALATRLISVVRGELARRGEMAKTQEGVRKRVSRGSTVTLLPEKTCPTRGEVGGLVYAADGQSVYAPINSSSNIVRWNLQSGEKDFLSYGSNGLAPNSKFQCHYAPQTERLYVKGSRQSDVRVFDTVSGLEVQSGLLEEGRVEPIAVSANGEFLAAESGEMVYLYRMKGDRAPQYVRGFDSFRMGRFTPDSRFLASVDMGKRTLHFAGVGGELFSVDYSSSFLGQQSHTMVHFAFRPGATQVVLADPLIPVVPVWDWKSGREVFQLETPDHTVPGFQGYYTVAYSPDGGLIAGISGAEAPMVRIWDAQSGEILTQWKTGRDSSFYLAFSPDGRRLATASVDGGIEIWDVEKALGRE